MPGFSRFSSFVRRGVNSDNLIDDEVPLDYFISDMIPPATGIAIRTLESVCGFK